MNKLEVSLEILKLVLASDDLPQKASTDERLDKVLDCFERIYRKLHVISEQEAVDSDIKAFNLVAAKGTDTNDKPDDQPGKKFFDNQLIFRIDSRLLREIQMVNTEEIQMVNPGDDQPGKPGGSSGTSQSGGSGGKR